MSQILLYKPFFQFGPNATTSFFLYDGWSQNSLNSTYHFCNSMDILLCVKVCCEGKHGMWFIMQRQLCQV